MKKEILFALAILLSIPVIASAQTVPYIYLTYAPNNTNVLQVNGYAGSGVTSILISYYADSITLPYSKYLNSTDGTFTDQIDISSLPSSSKQVTSFKACVTPPSPQVCSPPLISQYILSQLINFPTTANQALTNMQNTLSNVNTIIQQFQNATNITQFQNSLNDTKGYVAEQFLNLSENIDDLDDSISGLKGRIDALNTSIPTGLQTQIGLVNTKIDQVDADAKNREDQLDQKVTNSIGSSQVFGLIALMVSIITLLIVVLIVRKKLKKIPNEGRIPTAERPPFVIIPVSGELTEDKLKEIAEKISASVKPASNESFIKTQKQDEEWWKKFSGLVY